MRKLSDFTDTQINLEICVRAEGGFIEYGLIDYSLEELKAELSRRNAERRKK